ncbi:transcriptional coactivator p15/PC4 family protein [Sporobolomyces koalae]|uniref:transcriptional coactivator p15/PC4 family protein n=1 Tax=Sporobolomyces koalae TaxID=500713 RepID=UPI00316FD493
MPKKLSSEHVNSEDDSSVSDSAPRPVKTKKRTNPTSDSEEPVTQRTKSKKVKSSDDTDKVRTKDNQKSKISTRDDNNDDETKNEDKVDAFKNDDGDTYFVLSDKRRATVRKFGKTVGIDLRETYEKDGKEGLPGKKGIFLLRDQWEQLKKSVHAIDEAFDKVR